MFEQMDLATIQATPSVTFCTGSAIALDRFQVFVFSYDSAFVSVQRAESLALVD
jgi:hypothetical protein